MEPTRPDGPARRVLIVDDDDGTREALRELLTLWGHEVEDVATAPGALDVAQRFHPDVAIIDLGLSGPDGCELAKALRARPDCPLLIAHTGRELEGDTSGVLEAVFHMVVRKPAGIDQLEGILSAAPRRIRRA